MASIEKSTQRLVKIYRSAQKKLAAEFVNASGYRRAQIAIVQAQVDAILTKLQADTRLAVTEEVTLHYTDGVKRAHSQINRLTDSTLAMMSQLDEEAIAATITETMEDFNEAIAGAKRSSTRLLSKARRMRIERILAEGRITGQTSREIQAQIVDDLSNGFTALKDGAGRRWTLERYAEMLTRTRMRETTNQGLHNRMLREGNDLVVVSDHNSDHEACAVWEGKVLSITGKTDGYPTIQAAKDAGLFHPNCKHRTLPYRPEIRGDL